MKKKKKQLSVRNHGSQKRSKETFAAILDASIQVLSINHNHLTTNHIAERAGVSIGTLYQYFPNKQAIMGEVIRRELMKDLELFQANFAEKQARSIKEAVIHVVDVCIKINLRESNLKKAMFEFMVTSQKVKFIRDIHFQNVQLVSDYVSSAADWPKKIDPIFFSLMALSVAASVFQLMTEFGQIEEMKIRSELERLMLGYLQI